MKVVDLGVSPAFHYRLTDAFDAMSPHMDVRFIYALHAKMRISGRDAVNVRSVLSAIFTRLMRAEHASASLLAPTKGNS